MTGHNGAVLQLAFIAGKQVRDEITLVVNRFGKELSFVVGIEGKRKVESRATRSGTNTPGLSENVRSSFSPLGSRWPSRAWSDEGVACGRRV